jgi:cytochrome P450 monooxygenase
VASGSESALIDFPWRLPGQPFPPPAYAEVRQRPGLVRTKLLGGGTVWLVSRHEDVRALLTDRRISSDPRREGFPNGGPSLGVPRPDQVPGWFVGFDPPEHDRFRKTLIPEFSVRRIRELRPAIQGVVDGCIDAMLARGNSADLVADFALPVPSLVISALLGVPPADRGFFEAKTKTMVTLTATDTEREDAREHLLRYLTRLIEIKRMRPADDLISRLLAIGTLTPKELSGTAMLLLMAGHETTANNIALGVVTLLMHREWAGDSEAVEELLRLHSVADMVALRVAAEDLEIDGQLVRAGEGIIPLLAAANHDTTVFDHPGDFDPRRSAHQHVAFGYGVHQCLGQNLVRAEMEIAHRTLFERVPTLELAEPVEELPFKYDGLLFGLHELPARW